MTPHKPHRVDVEDIDFDDEEIPGQMPIEPDNGLVPPLIPEDPEHDRTIDPEARPHELHAADKCAGSLRQLLREPRTSRGRDSRGTAAHAAGDLRQDLRGHGPGAAQ